MQRYQYPGDDEAELLFLSRLLAGGVLSAAAVTVGMYGLLVLIRALVG